MKKITTKAYVCLLLALLMMLVCVLGACSDKDEQPQAVSIDLSQYKIIRSQKATSEATSAAMTLRRALMDLGTTLELSDDWYAEGSYDASSKEILIGQTNRDESAAVLAEIDGDGYAVALRGNKIVITATKDTLLGEAVAYFCGSVLAGNTQPTLEADYLYLSEPYTVLDFVSGIKCNYTLIRGDKAHDYTVDLAGIVREKVMNVSSARNVSFLTDASTSAADENLEILIGDTNRPESAKALEGLAYNEYCVKFIGNKIVLNAWSLKGVEAAVNAFCDVVAENVNADKSVTIPTFKNVIGKLDSAIDGIPTPEGLSLLSAYQGLDDTYESVYKNASKKDYDAYLSSLAANGYAKYDDNTIGDNCFATYTKGKTAIYVSFSPWDSTLRVICETYKALPAVEKESYTRVTDSTLAQLSLDGAGDNFGMSYVVTLEDGSYIIVDGGGNASDDEIKLYDFLRDNNKRTDNKIVIAAWIFTHEHYDHVTNFIDFSNKYASSVTLESVIWNMVQAYEHDDAGIYYSQMLSSINKYGKVNVIKAHAGQRMWVRNAEIDILITHESLSPYKITNLNNTSTVFRMNIAGKSILFLGDTQTLTETNSADKVLMEMYGEELKSDIVQVAHHGLDGVKTEIYDLIAPSTALIPVEYHSNDYEYAMSYSSTLHLYEMKNRGIIKEIIVAAEKGTVIIDLK